MPKKTKDKNLNDELMDSLNKKFKSFDKVAYYLNDSEYAPSDVLDWVPTGSSMLDLAISNRPYGGFPVGRITEIAGLEASGKSLLAAHALKSTQEKGGLAVYIDTENAVSRQFFQAVGVDLESLLYLSLETIEDIFEAIEEIINSIRKNNRDRLVTIVVDSIMGASTRPETAAEYDKDGFATSKALILSKAMRKITNFLGREKICLIITNQLREKLGVMFGDKYTTSGGKAIGFHASVRVRLKSIGQLTVQRNGIKSVIGIQTSAKVIKNRMGPPLKNVEYDIFFDSGIDDYGSWLKTLKMFKLVETSGSKYTYTVVDPETGEVIEQVSFKSNEFYEKVLSNPQYKEHVYKQICDILISEYKINKEIGIDDIEINDDFVNEDA